MDRSEGRLAFGASPRGYDRARPAYPEHVYNLLVERCGLGPGCRTLEIGPGTGLATRRLLALGAGPLLALEPDERLAAFLAGWTHEAELPIEIRVESFEDAELEPGSFDLVVAATSFHWVEQPTGLTKVARALRPGGWMALCWNVFGDPALPDPYHEATRHLLRPLAESPSVGIGGRPPFALDVEQRLEEIRAAGFVNVHHELIHWISRLDPVAVRALYATFSPITRLPEAEQHHLLDELERIAREEFGRLVERTFATTIYLGQRP